MKKLLAGVVVLAMIVVIGPVLFNQVIKGDARSYSGVRLSETRFSEIRFHNTVQNIELGGMLFIPRGEGPFPAVVVIHGSGTSRRDNGWYLTLTKHLQESGIVVLLPDKRGSVKSGGRWQNSSMEDLATDTLAAIRYLKDQDRPELSSIGVVGMSEGGRIVPIVATRSRDVSFVVNVVGGAISSHEQLLYEENYNLREMGFLPGVSNVIAQVSTPLLINVSKKEFWDAVGDFDPLPYWNKVNVPSLVLYGEQDTNVPSAASAERIRLMNKSNINIRIYKGSGHALEDPVGAGDSIFRAEALKDIRDFILLSKRVEKKVSLLNGGR